MKFVVLILFSFLNGKGISQSLESAVLQIAKENIIECEFVGMGGSKSELYENYKYLRKNASKNELIQLLEHDSLAVVGYSAFALLENKLLDPEDIIEKIIHNKQRVISFCGCLMDEQTISTLVYERVYYEKIYTVESIQFLNMDSLIIYSPYANSKLTAIALNNRIYKENYKDRIRVLAFEKHNFSALKYLIDNKKEENELRIESTLRHHSLHNENKNEREEAQILLGKSKR